MEDKKPTKDNNEKPEVQIARTTARQAIIVAIIGAIVSLATIFKDVINPNVKYKDINKVEEKVNNTVDEKVNEKVDKRIENSNGDIIIEKIPIGTIVSSTLRYTTFLETNGMTITENMSSSKWVPCDGRRVIDSKYGQVKDSVPDLRGLFLRNVNDYGVGFDGVSKVLSERANPDNTPAGKFQSDNLKEHNHSFATGGGSSGPRDVVSIDTRKEGDTPTSNFGGKETRPKNMTVYYYIKIN